MEHHPTLNGWQTANALSGFTGSGYIFWDKSENFNSTGFGKMTFKLKISTPGTYRFDWRVAVGRGTSTTEHNDTWLLIGGVDNFYGQKESNAASLVKPKPACNTDPTYKCPAGSTTGGYFKIYGGLVNTYQWRAFTFDNDPHEIYFVKNTPGEITIDIAARSSFQFIDKLIVYKIDQYTRSAARQTAVQENCSSLVNVDALQDAKQFVYPNPVADKLFFDRTLLGASFQIFNTKGQVVKKGKINADHLDVSQLKSSMYHIVFRGLDFVSNTQFVKF